MLSPVHVERRSLFIEPHELEAGRAVLEEIDSLLIALDRLLALALVPEPGAHLSVQVCNSIQVLLLPVVFEAFFPHLECHVDPTDTQGNIALLFADPRDRARVVWTIDLARSLVVSERLGIGIQQGRGVTGSLEEAKRLDVDRLDLVVAEADLLAERRGTAVMLGQQRDDLVGAVTGTLLDEAADLEVLLTADGLREHSVCDVADQDVLERELALVGKPPAGVRHDDVLVLQRGQRFPELTVAVLRDRRQRPLPERAADHRRMLHEQTLEWLQRVEARRKERLHGVGQLGHVARGLFLQPANHLLGEERVASRSLGHDRHRFRVPALGRQQRAHELARLVGCERVEQDRGRLPASRTPCRAAFEQLVARQAQQDERTSHPLSEVLDQVEHSVVGPVDVLERQDQWVPLGHRFDRRANRGEECLSHALRVVGVERSDI
jgi:hypothetical protein